MKLIKIHFAQEPLSDTAAKVLSQAMFEAARQAGIEIPPSAVEILDLAAGRVYRGARLGSRIRAQIEATCQNISALWPTIAPPQRRRRG